MFKKRKGFTLIELMIVIAIIAILAAILVPNFVRARSQGQLAACKSNLKNIGTACEMYASDNSGVYPSAIITGTASFSPYMATLPTCPLNGAYTFTAGTTSYTANCTGATPHLGLGAGFPRYTPSGGLVDR